MNDTTADTIFDRAEMLDRLGGDEQLVVELLELFLEESESMVTAIEQALKEADSAAVAASAHSLKGALLNISAASAAASARRLEQAGHDGALSDGARQLACLKEDVGELCRTLRAGS